MCYTTNMQIPIRSLILPNIRSCHNVGAMFRTADACGFDHIYLCGYTAQPPKVQIDKVALGAETWIPWTYYEDTLTCIKAVQQQGAHVVALEQTSKSIPITTYIPSAPLALIVGNEVEGITEEMLALVDTTVHIPMYGKKESLNVSVAAGIIMYHIISHTV